MNKENILVIHARFLKKSPHTAKRLPRVSGIERDTMSPHHVANRLGNGVVELSITAFDVAIDKNDIFRRPFPPVFANALQNYLSAARQLSGDADTDNSTRIFAQTLAATNKPGLCRPCSRRQKNIIKSKASTAFFPGDFVTDKIIGARSQIAMTAARNKKWPTTLGAQKGHCLIYCRGDMVERTGDKLGAKFGAQLPIE